MLVHAAKNGCVVRCFCRNLSLSKFFSVDPRIFALISKKLAPGIPSGIDLHVDLHSAFALHHPPGTLSSINHQSSIVLWASWDHVYVARGRCLSRSHLDVKIDVSVALVVIYGIPFHGTRARMHVLLNRIASLRIFDKRPFL